MVSHGSSRENPQSLINFIGYNFIVPINDNNTGEGKDNPKGNK
jgi:hypothetical protein